MATETYRCINIKHKTGLYTIRHIETNKVRCLGLNEISKLTSDKQIRLIDNTGKTFNIIKDREQYEKVTSAVRVKSYNLLKELSIVLPHLLDRITPGNSRAGVTYYSLIDTETMQEQADKLTDTIMNKASTSGIISDSVAINDGIAIRNTVTFRSDGYTIEFKSQDGLSLSHKWIKQEFKPVGTEHTSTAYVTDMKTTMLDHMLYTKLNSRIQDLSIKGMAENIRDLRLSDRSLRYIKYNYILSECLNNSKDQLTLTSTSRSIFFNETLPSGKKVKRFTLHQLYEDIHDEIKDPITLKDISKFLGGEHND